MLLQPLGITWTHISTIPTKFITKNWKFNPNMTLSLAFSLSHQILVQGTCTLFFEKYFYYLYVRLMYPVHDMYVCVAHTCVQY